MNKAQKKFIDTEFAKYGIKANSGFNYIKIKNLFFVITNTYEDGVLSSLVQIKKYDYDDIYWDILELESISRKSISERIVGEHAVQPVNIHKFILENVSDEVFEESITQQINEVTAYIKLAAEKVNMLRLIYKSNCNSFIKVIAHISEGQISEAIRVDREAIDNRAFLGTHEGRFIEFLVLERYDGDFNSSYEEQIIDDMCADYSKLPHNLQKLLSDIPELADKLIVDNSAESSTNVSATDVIIDDPEWHYDASLELYCKKNWIDDTSLLSDFELESIINRSAVHIAYFITWLCMNDYIKCEDVDMINDIKARQKTGIDILFQVFGGKFNLNCVIDTMQNFVVEYYQNSKTYYVDYGNTMNEFGIERYESDFSWDIYDDIYQRLDRRYNNFPANS